MISLSAYQLSAMHKRAEEGFVETVRAFLSEEYPAFLPRFPLPVQQAITRMLIGRAEAAGATLQSTVGTWLMLMLNVAPNLGDDPAVRAWLASTGSNPDERIGALDHLLTESDWERVDSARCDLALVTSPELDAAAVVVRTAAALRWVMWDAGASRDLVQMARESTETAAQFGLADSADAPLAIAMARHLYAREARADAPGWLQDLQNPQLRPRVRVEMLRARIMLDHGRWA